MGGLCGIGPLFEHSTALSNAAGPSLATPLCQPVALTREARKA